MAYKLSFENHHPEQSAEVIPAPANPHRPFTEEWLAENEERALRREEVARGQLLSVGYTDDMLNNGTYGPAMLRAKVQEIADQEDRFAAGGGEAGYAESDYDTSTGHPAGSRQEQGADDQPWAVGSDPMEHVELQDMPSEHPRPF